MPDDAERIVAVTGAWWHVPKLYAMEPLTYDKKTLRGFGYTMGIAFLVFAVLFFLRHKPYWHVPYGLALFFFIAGALVPLLLKPVYGAWMGLAFALAWVNTRLLLLLLFVLVFTPVGLLLRLLRKDLIDRKFTRRASYWHRKEKTPFDPKRYEHQF